jgi:tetratricopeptide (TPR) repeat protein
VGKDMKPLRDLAREESVLRDIGNTAKLAENLTQQLDYYIDYGMDEELKKCVHNLRNLAVQLGDNEKVIECSISLLGYLTRKGTIDEIKDYLISLEDIPASIDKRIMMIIGNVVSFRLKDDKISVSSCIQKFIESIEEVGDMTVRDDYISFIAKELKDLGMVDEYIPIMKIYLESVLNVLPDEDRISVKDKRSEIIIPYIEDFERSCNDESMHFFSGGEFEKAAASLEKLYRIAIELKQYQLQARTAGRMALFYRRMGRFDEAVSLHDESILLFERQSMTNDKLIEMLNKAIALEEAANVEEAVKQLEETIRISKDNNVVNIEAAALGNLAVYLVSLGRYDKVMDLHRREEEIFRANQEYRDLAISLANQCNFLIHQGGQDASDINNKLAEAEQLSVTYGFMDVHKTIQALKSKVSELVFSEMDIDSVWKVLDKYLKSKFGLSVERSLQGETLLIFMPLAESEKFFNEKIGIIYTSKSVQLQGKDVWPIEIRIIGNIRMYTAEGIDTVKTYIEWWNIQENFPQIQFVEKDKTIIVNKTVAIYPGAEESELNELVKSTIEFWLKERILLTFAAIGVLQIDELKKINEVD